MPQVLKHNPDRAPRPHPGLMWPAAVALGLGLWILNGGTGGIPEILIWIGIGLVAGGALMIFLDGAAAFNRPALLPSLLLPLCTGIGIAVVLLWTEHTAGYLSFRYPLDDGEGFVLNQAVRIASGVQLYPPINTEPYIVTNYPPLFQAALSIFTDSRNPSFFAGRFISVVSSIVLALAAAGCVRAATRNAWAGLIAGVLVIASPVVYFWGALLRVDVFASMLGLVALWIAMSAKGTRILWSLPFAVGAIMTRQSSVEAAVAIVLALIFYRNAREEEQRESVRIGVIYILAWVAAVLAILIFLQVSTDGEFWRHIVSYTRTRFYPRRILSAMAWILPTHALMILLALLALPSALKKPERRMMGIFFILSFCTAMLSGKVGSDLNYFINFVVASACLTGFFASDLFAAARNSKPAPKWLIPLAFLIPAALVQSGLMEGQRSYSFTPIEEDRLNGARIVEILSSVNGPILSEDEGFCLLAGHEVFFNPFIMSEMAREGIWDQEPFVESIENKSFDLIMLRFDVNDPMNDDRPGVGTHAGWNRFTEAMEVAIAENYEIDFDISPIYMRRLWFIYKPIREEEPNLENDSVEPETGESMNLLGGAE